MPEHWLFWVLLVGSALWVLTSVLTREIRNAAWMATPELSKIMGMPGKPEGMHGAEVEPYFLDGKIKEIADYCETDVVNTYRVWLKYELFRGRPSESEHRASERSLADFIAARVNTKVHLNRMVQEGSA
jgi:3'-5' exonuclease